MAVSIDKRPFGSLPDGRDVHVFEITNSVGTSLRVIDYGCIITSVRTKDRDGAFGEITLAFDTLQEYLSGHPYYGSFIGRVANRVSGGGFEIGGRFYELASNQRGVLHLHGGVRGFDKQLYRADQTTANDRGGVRFERTSPDGEEGYPGNLAVAHTISLTEDDRLVFEYEATTDASTVVNLTNHTYWNLSGEETILDHELKLNAETVAVAENALPTGELAPLSEGDPLDFSTWKRIGADIERIVGNAGYDHSYFVRGAGTELDAKGDLLHAASVRSAASGRRMDVHTTSPDVHFYSGNHLPGQKGRDGRTLRGREALCLECEFFPDAPNKHAFPPIFLDPGARYYQRTEHHFSAE